VPTPSYTDADLADLAKITRDIIGNNGPLVADRIIREIEASLMHVATYPHVGRKRSQISKGLLSWPVSS
jgi:plasmid stabilization system protein ParE